MKATEAQLRETECRTYREEKIAAYFLDDMSHDEDEEALGEQCNQHLDNLRMELQGGLS